MIKYQTREEWLTEAAAAIISEFGEDFDRIIGPSAADHLAHLKVSAGFPSKMGLTSRIGECWKASSAQDGVSHHIFINPRLVDPVEVLATLAHEAVHAADDGEHSHRGPFTRMVRAMGLEGKPTATVAGEVFAEWASGLARHLGDYPHTALVSVSSPTKKQTTRMIKVMAPCCGYVARTTRVWLEVGSLSCPCGNEMEVV